MSIIFCPRSGPFTLTIYKCCIIYVVVNIILVLVWAFAAGGGYPWFLWVLGGWGIGILFHFLGVFVFGRKSDRAAIEKEVEKIKREQG
ncbi:2TM domain-containing protein [Chloroflexota bacterium]